MARSSVTYAGRVRPGDVLLDNGRSLKVTKVRRAQGRKPAEGENLHLIAGGETVKHNSLDPVRIIPTRN